jgi:quinol monooxygenase YgiN
MEVDGMTVAVVCKYTIKDGQESSFLAVMNELIRLTKQEEGCIAYDLYKPQSESETGLVLVEVWQSEEALKKHMKSEHFQRLVPAADVYKEVPTDINIYNGIA